MQACLENQGDKSRLSRPLPQRLRSAATRTVLAAPLLLGWIAPAQAQSLSGTLNAQMTLTAGCLVLGGSGATSSINLGSLTFPVQAATFTGQVPTVVTGGPAGAGVTQIICSPNITGVTVTIGPGQHPGQGTGVGTGSRAMANGASFIPYDVFPDASHTTAYTANAPVSVPISIPGSAFPLPIYGLVNKTDPAALPAGTYSDQLQVTLTF